MRKRTCRMEWIRVVQWAGAAGGQGKYRAESQHAARSKQQQRTSKAHANEAKVEPV